MVQLIFKSVDGAETVIDAPPGDTIMEAALANGVPGIDADCGGSMVCGTCHVQVDEAWQARLPAQSTAELALLDYVPEPKPNSRLTCQIPVSEDHEGLVMYVPGAQH